MKAGASGPGGVGRGAARTRVMVVRTGGSSAHGSAAGAPSGAFPGE